MDDILPQNSEGRLPLPNASLPPHVRGLVQSLINDQKFLEEDLCQCGLCIKQLEDNIQRLDNEKSKTMFEFGKLQALLDVTCSYKQECTPENKLVMVQIGRTSGSAAAVVCKVLQSMATEEISDFANNILGVVACLGTVQTDYLSRILAEYLGKDQMLAIVCKSLAYASDLVKNEPNGQINSACGLHALAAKLELPINGQYLVICLENIRAYTGEISSDPQRKLALPDPVLSNGRPPPGYLGYAVNMIDLDVSHCHCKTPSGHGLRETLFYRLFGDLQVYENREAMNKATSCIIHSAVSLDGGIIRHGLFTLGNQYPNILFPVVSTQSQMHFSARTVEIMKQIEEKKQKLQETVDLLKRERETHRKAMVKYAKKHAKYKMFLRKEGDSLSVPSFRLLRMHDS